MKFAHFEFDPQTDRLGEGPLSEVYKAVDLRLGRTVALKILRAHAEIDPKADTRFLREAKHTSNLAHPNIATVYEYGQDDHRQTSYIAMEYLQGRTLDHIIKDQTLGYEEGLRIALQVADALARVHEAGLIHRDLKPGNIMVQDDGAVKLLDFGIARATDEAAITQHGMLVGTVLYMAPEQVRGDELDARSDMFSFGAVLYHALTNKLPFPGKSFPEVCMAILDGRPKRPSDVRRGFPPALEDLVLRCLSNDPADRFPDAAAAHGALLAASSSLTATNGVVSQTNLEGTLLVPPLACGAGDAAACANMAAGVRKDLAGELARGKGIEVRLVEDDALPAEGDYDWVLRGELSVEPPQGRLDLVLEHYEDRGQGRTLKEMWRDPLEHTDEDEWGLQADLVRSAARVVRRRMAEVARRPAVDLRRNVEEARRLAHIGHDVLHRGTTKHLLSAISSFRRALEADPYCSLAYAGQAECMVRKFLYWDGDATFLEEARAQASRALTLDPQCAEAHTSLGFAYHLSGHPSDAQREYRLAIQLDEREWLAHRLLGSLLAREGNFKNASPLLSRSIALKPTHIGSYDHLYIVLQRLDRAEEALGIADEGVGVATKHLTEVPDNQEARLHLARLLARLGHADRAHAHVERALQLAPKDAFTWYHAGCVFAVLGEVGRAVEALDQARNRGFYVQSELPHNTDLDVLRGVPEFQKLLAG